MLKKRLVFTLLIRDGVIQLSRNFSLQGVGDIEWLDKHYDFQSTTRAVDELVLLNVGRENKDTNGFSATVHMISKRCFMPIAAGGGVGSLEDAYRILDAGADKLIVNTILYTNPSVVKGIVKTFGSQCVVASIDYKYNQGVDEVYMHNGTCQTGKNVSSAVGNAERLGVGEIYLTSMDRDGTGQGCDVMMLSKVAAQTHVPVVASGGVGDYKHFVEGMSISNVTGVSTANIFNFLGEGLVEARSYVNQSGIELAHWDFEKLHIRQQ